jgi:membrane-associated phospholipid phosphatase
MGPLASLTDLELRFLHWVACGEDDLRDALASFVNDALFGTGVVVLFALLPALTARGRALFPRTALAVLVALGLAHGLREVVWRVAPRPRPASTFSEDRILRGVLSRETCDQHPDWWVERGHPPRVPSFPSSHVITAAACAGALTFGSRWAGALAWLYALLVGWGRLYWGKHWPSDILGSLVLGAAAGWAGWRLSGAFLARLARRRPPVTPGAGETPPAGDAGSP